MKLNEVLREGKEDITIGSLNVRDVEKIEDQYGSDVSVYVNGYVDINGHTFRELPFEITKVTGYFDCEKCDLITLKGFPDYVGDTFNCSNNNLDTLSYGPSRVDGGFSCAHNQIEDLSFMPTSVNYWIDVSHNRITSLHGVPEKIDGDLEASFNRIDSFRFGPTELGSDFNISDNELTSFDHSPNHVAGTFNVSNNKITSLRNIHHELLSCSRLVLNGNPIEEGGIGLLLIPGNPILDVEADDCGRFSDAFDIIKKYLGQGKKGLLECQEELHDADLEEFARL